MNKSNFCTANANCTESQSSSPLLRVSQYKMDTPAKISTHLKPNDCISLIAAGEDLSISSVLVLVLVLVIVIVLVIEPFLLSLTPLSSLQSPQPFKLN